jgi:tetratricopeptide (TPR) repeat protein
MQNAPNGIGTAIVVELGYIQPPDADAQKAVRQVVDHLQFHLGLCLRHYGSPSEAAKIFDGLLSTHPADKRYALSLARLYYRLGEHRKSYDHHQAISKLRANRDKPSPTNSDAKPSALG